MKVKITNVSITEEGKEPFINGFRNDLGEPTDGLETIFPIVHLSSENPFKPIGTGFFISNNGLFATAKHVLLDNDKDILDSLAGIHIVREQELVVVRQIKKVTIYPIADVAIGCLIDKLFLETGVQTENKFLDLTSKIPQIGEKVVTYAFPLPKYIQNNEAFESYYTCKRNSGVIQDYFPSGRDRTFLPSKCFQTNMVSFGGVSGGPVAMKDKGVFGINSTGIDGNDISYVSSIHDIFDLGVPNCLLPDKRKIDNITIKELAKHNLIIINK